MHQVDYSIRVHRSTADSGQNEAERTNAASGDAIVDGGTIKWETHKQFEGLTDDEISALSLQEYEQLEAERMRKNAWQVTDQLVMRLDDAPIHSEFIRSLKSDAENEQFFFNKILLKDYVHKSEEARKNIPGAAYFQKIFKFYDDHYESGELYMELKKGACQRTKGELCEFCTETGWSGPEMHRIPRPEPDYERLPDYHYKCVFDTSSQNPDGTERNPDDYQPRANLKTAFKDDLISLGDNNSVKAFSDKFVVKEALVREYLEHLKNLELGKQLRSRQRERERIENKAKIYEDYDWNRLVEERELGKLKVFELDRYISIDISHHKLPTVGKESQPMSTKIGQNHCKISMCTAVELTAMITKLMRKN